MLILFVLSSFLYPKLDELTLTKYQPEAWELALTKRPYFGVFDMKDEYVAEQQQVADLFYKQNLIPKAIQVKEVIWKPQ